MLIRTSLVIAVGTAALIAVGGRAILSAGAPKPPLVITHGIASGDVTPTSAVIWARASSKAQMHVEIDTEPTLGHAKSHGSAKADEATDFTAHLVVDGLQPSTRYWYRVWLSGAGGTGRSVVDDNQIGTFTTAPSPWDSRPLSFILAAGSDTAGTPRQAATRFLARCKDWLRISSSSTAMPFMAMATVPRPDPNPDG